MYNKTWTIYKHTCLVNGFSYIGQTSQNLNERFRKDGSGYKLKTSPFCNAIKKYGWKNFSHEILKSGIESRQEANFWETYYIKKYDTYICSPSSRGYNQTLGGESRDGYKMSQKTKDLLSEITCKRKIICIETQQILNGEANVNKKLGVTHSHVGDCCNGLRQIAVGYHWAWLDDLARQEELKSFIGCPQKITKLAKRKVLCVETQEIFESIAQARKKYPSCISKALSGERELAAGYHWRYVDDNN